MTETRKSAESRKSLADREKGQLNVDSENYDAGNEAAQKLLLLHAAVSAGLTNEEAKELQESGDLSKVVQFGIPKPQHEIDRENEERKDREKEQEKNQKALDHAKQNPIDPT